MPYTIEFAEGVKQQLQRLTARQRTIVIETIEQQLTHEPLVETRNRKKVRPNPLAPWELRIDNLRVFYEVESNEADVVRVLAVGEKRGNRLFVGGVEVKL